MFIDIQLSLTRFGQEEKKEGNSINDFRINLYM